MIKIYGLPFSVHVRKTLVTAIHKNIAHENVPVFPFEPPAGWRDLSPTGLIPAMSEGRPLLQRAAPALGAIERAVPGLAQRIAPQQPSLSAGLIGLLGQPAEIEGKRGVTVPVRFTDGAASFGPIPLGQVPPAF